MNMRFRVAPSIAGAAVLAVAGCHGAHALADPAGDQILAHFDKAMNRARTLDFEYEVVNKEPNKDERSMSIEVKLKGEKRLTQFQTGEIKGTKVLVLSPTQMYVYLPAFGKVRRIASHSKDQGFLGMTFSQDDMALTAYGPQYTASKLSENAAAVTLSLTPKPGQETRTFSVASRPPPGVPLEPAPGSSCRGHRRARRVGPCRRRRAWSCRRDG